MLNFCVESSEWQAAAVTLYAKQTIVVFEAVRGGHTIAENRGDICIDNIKIVYNSCRKKNLKFPSPFITQGWRKEAGGDEGEGGGYDTRMTIGPKTLGPKIFHYGRPVRRGEGNLCQGCHWQPQKFAILIFS